jgi:hypothetical protein
VVRRRGDEGTRPRAKRSRQRSRDKRIRPLDRERNTLLCAKGGFTTSARWLPIIRAIRTVTTFAGGSGIANVDVDPAEVVRAAFQGAASVAGLCTTTEAMT